MRRLSVFLLLAASAFGQRAADTNVVVLPGAAPSTPRKEASWRPLPAATTDAAAASTERGPRHGMFWKASSGTNTVYLTGSIHAATAGIYPLPKQIEAAFRSATVLVVEVNLNKLDTRKLRDLMSAGFYPPGDTLWKHISTAGKQAVLQFCAENGMPPEFFGALKPWMAILVASSLPTMSAGMSPAMGIDQHFLDRVVRGMRVEQIETPEQQVQLFAGMFGDNAEQVLMEALQSAKTNTRTAWDLQSAWLSGDTQKVEALVASMYNEVPEFAEVLIGARNVRMAEVVERHLNGRERCFVVVGAAHMVGENGVVRLLEQKGYRVEQIFSAPE